MKKVSILIGIPGSGKSTWARAQEGAVICSADHHHVTASGRYVYEPSRAGEAHLACLRKCLDALEEGKQHVIIDNTNIYNWERAPYAQLARMHEYEVEFVRFDVDPEIALERGIHNVPAKTVWRMLYAMEEPLSRWGSVVEVDARDEAERQRLLDEREEHLAAASAIEAELEGEVKR